MIKVEFDGTPTEDFLRIMGMSEYHFGLIEDNNVVVGVRIKTKTDELRVLIGDTIIFDESTTRMIIERKYD